MTLEDILPVIKAGGKASHPRLGGYVRMVTRVNRRPAIVIREGAFEYPYAFTNIDVFADDWEVVE